MKHSKLIILFALLLCCNTKGQALQYLWLHSDTTNTPVIKDIIEPEGFTRVVVDSGSFENWLRYLHLKIGDNRVRLYDGSLKTNQNAQYRIIAIDVGEHDLQQCADAIIRLRSEYLYSIKEFQQIAFDFTSEDRAEFWKWAQGYRPIIQGNNVTWERKADTILDLSYDNFRAYLNVVFMYAGSYSLAKELVTIDDTDNVRIGDIFIKGGFPGHAVIVVDLAVNKTTNKKAMLLAQSYMPAQEIHILKNPNNHKYNPWYILEEGNLLVTPEFTFEWTDLKRFK